MIRAELVELATQNTEVVLTRLGTTAAGLSSREATTRLRRSGPNTLIIKRPIVLRTLLYPLINPMALLIWTAGLIAFFGESLLAAFGIWSVNLINALFVLWQERQTMGRLRQPMLPIQTRLLRDGLPATLPTRDVVAGDVLLLEPGPIAADAYLLAANDLHVNQVLITGTSVPAMKRVMIAADLGQPLTAFPNLLLAGTVVESGSGQAVVLRTGGQMLLGQLLASVFAPKQRQSPLQHSFRQVARTVAVLALGAGLLTFVMLAATGDLSLRNSVVVGLGTIVAFVPEGLLPTIAGALALARRRLARHAVQVRRSAGLDALGAIDFLCMDKTGTLTQNTITATTIWLEGEELSVSGTGYGVDGAFLRGRALVEPRSHRTLQQLLRAGTFAATARLLPPPVGTTQWLPLGDRTEAAILVAAQKAGIDPGALVQAVPETLALAFDSARGYSASLRPDGPLLMAYVEGAPAIILDGCSHYMLDGLRQPLTPRTIGAVDRAYQALSARGLRVVAVAQRAVPNPQIASLPEEFLQGLTLLGLVGLTDPPRPEVTTLIERCRAAGLRLLLVTGDDPAVSLDVAHKAGLIHSATTQVVTGQMIAAMDVLALRRILAAGEVIIAQVNPGNKARLIELLQSDGATVGMLGDGTNDAPALQQADVGILLTDTTPGIALDAADVTLPAGRPDKLILALEEGRAIFANLRKLLTYLFAHNMAEALIVIVAALLRVPPPLLVRQVLAIDLGSEILPAVALAGEPPEPAILKRPPRGRNVVDRRMLVRSLLWIGVIEGAFAMVLFCTVPWLHGWRLGQLFPAGLVYRQSTTFAFLGILAAQLGNVFASRSERASIREIGWLSNLNLIWSVLADLVLLALLLFVPILRDFFGFALPPLNLLPLLLVPPCVVLLAEEVRKLVMRRWEARAVRPSTVTDQMTAASQ
ncbi:MAG: cation-transporting P-type ATPase [Herpetosiphonaceae bacterium]|nr:cation-transporting P-type ATPase [Herpetosiphonaceae bacterium]